VIGSAGGNFVEHVLNISMDVTEEYKLRLELEEEYAFVDMLIEHSPDILVVLDKELRIVAWNRKAEEHKDLGDTVPVLVGLNTY